MGVATLYLVAQQNFVYRANLDIQGLKIKKVKDDRGINLFYKISSTKPEQGENLEIQFADAMIMSQVKAITIEYETTPDQQASSWLTKEQTDGKRLPYMFTQCESIHCRSIAPLQDTPAVKITYDLLLRVPRSFEAYASGN